MTFADFMSTMVRVRDDRAGTLSPPVLHAEEVRLCEAMDAINPTTGLRQFLTVIVSWPRKCGKTFIAACMGIYMLVFDRHHTHREVIVQASTRDQGQSACFKAMRRLVSSNPWLQARIQVSKDSMLYVDEAGIEHTVKVLPNSPGAVHGLNGSCVIYDEGWVHPNWEALEGTSPSPARVCPLTVWASYSGLKSQRTPDNPWYSVLSAAQRGDDPTVFLSHLSGRAGALSVPWITPGWLERLEAQFAHVRSKFLRLGYNVWSASDTGAFLTEEEITAAVDPNLPLQITTRTPRPTARIGVDLGLVKDRTAIVATDIAPDGRLEVLHVELIQGTRKHPVSLIDVETRILWLARQLGTTHVAVDRWQSAQMIEGLRKRGLWITPVTCDAAWLDRAATNLKLWFSQRHIRIPPHPGFLEELEGLEAEELRRRDRVRFTATGSNHDDGCVALCLAAEAFAGGAKRPETTAIGRKKLPEIGNCAAAEAMGQWSVSCPIAMETPSLQPGCVRCPMVQEVGPAYDTHIASPGTAWISLGQFALTRYAPNAWLRQRRFSAACAWL
jgi:hypothetical protein